jgi:hypothetical protein
MVHAAVETGLLKRFALPVTDSNSIRSGEEPSSQLVSAHVRCRRPLLVVKSRRQALVVEYFDEYFF